MRTLRAVCTSGVLIAFICGIGWPAGAQVPPPEVSPLALPDVPPPPGAADPFPFFDNYSWRSFIALNWPAMTGAANRGEPDRTKAFGDPGPRVWTTWKSRYEIFQRGGAMPSPWASYAGENPCGPSFANYVVTLKSFSAFRDFNQAVFKLKVQGNPLVAQNQTYVRYEVRVNQPEFDSIVGNKWYIASNLPPDPRPQPPAPPAPPPPTSKTIPFNTGSTEIKAAWRILTEKDTPAIRSRYYVVPNAQVFDVASSTCKPQDIALVGLHIVTKTPSRPQWIWSTFEHVDNVPGITTEPKPPAGVPFSFNDLSLPQTLSPASRPNALSLPDNPPVPNPSPMQVVRKQAIKQQTMDMNKAFWNLPQIQGTVWQNYMLVMTQWPMMVAPESPSNDGAPLPARGSALANTTMETYFQFDGGSCMDCHGSVSNQGGRDFVMFVTMDAFRPEGDPFAAKTAGEALETGTTLSADPMVKALIEFFDAAKEK